MKLAHLKKHEDITIENNQHTLVLTGPLGKVSIKLPENIQTTYTKDKVYLHYKKKNTAHALTYKGILKNLIQGLHQGYVKVLRLSGLGYKTNFHKKLLYLKLGNSHTTLYQVPNEVYCKTINNKYICLCSTNLQKLNQITHQIKEIKKLNAYKGKGILEKDQQVILKETKKK